jgi:hypothetical protein
MQEKTRSLLPLERERERERESMSPLERERVGKEKSEGFCGFNHG